MDSAWAALPAPHRPAPDRGTATDPAPPPHRSAPAVHRHPAPQCPLRRRPVWQKRQGFRARGRPPRRRRRCCGRVSILVGASGERATVGAAPPARGPDPAPSLRPRCQRCGLQSFQPNEPPCCGLQQEGQPGETPPGPGLATAPSGLRSEDHLHALPIQPRGPTLRLPPPFQPNEHPRCGLRPEGQLRAGPIPARLILHLGLPLTTTFARWTNAPRQRTGRCAAPIRQRPEGRTPPPLRHPIGTKPSGRADPGKPPPASWQRPARPPARRKDAPSMQPPARRKPPARLTSYLKEERLPRYGLRVEASIPQASPSDPRDRCRQASRQKEERPSSMQPPTERGERADTHPAQTEGIPRPPSWQGRFIGCRLIGEASLSPEAKDGQHCALRLERHSLR